MTDTAKSWIEERREFVQGSKLRRWGDKDIRRLTNAVEAVLELHRPKKRFPLKDGSWEMSCEECDTHITFTMWPCKTVRAIEGAIND